MLGFTLKNWLTNNQQCLKTTIFHVTKMTQISATIENQCNNSTTNATVEKMKFLVKLLKIDTREARHYLKANQLLRMVPNEQIAETYALCLKYGIGNEVKDIIGVISLKASTLERRITYFQELGCTKLLANILKPFMTGCEYSLQQFQDWNLLPADVDIAKNIFSVLNKPPPDVPCLDSLKKSNSIHTYRSICLEHYLKWRLEYTEKELSKLTAVIQKFRYFSIRSIEEVIDCLENELEFSKAKIKQANFLLRADATNIKQLLTTYKQVAGSDMKPLLIKNPKLLDVKADLIPARLEILKKHGVTESALKVYPTILLLSKETIESRLKEIQSIPELRGFLDHQRLLLLILYLRKAKDRLQFMKEHNVKSISLFTLSSSSVYFNRQLEEGLVRAKGTDLLQFLSKNTGASQASIHRSLQKNSMWLHAPFIHVVDTYFYLIERNYTNEDILNNVHVLLYKSSRVEQVLEKIESDESEKSNNWSPSQKLALCVYYIEKKFHFSGLGVLEDTPEQHLLTSDQVTKNQVLKEE
ncbi:transcription termination factor 5, mitochondrial [Neodiprion pinetum]|uniref:transcription termination factor 5, mitochondrial n=1 Tax=Neodiprion pinetum TaxID=441929 RepID=UPI001EDDDFB5|nr:transcription termination factor 5, mitochondrial [Neodiprion pinetum]